MICSILPGRVRLRSRRFKNAEAVASLIPFLESQPGVLSVENNPNTGSLLVRFDPDQVDREATLAALSFLEEGDESPEVSGPLGLNKEAAEYVAMLGAFVVCLSSGFLRSKGLHIYSGLTLAGLTVQHVVKYRGRLAAILNVA